MGIFDFGKRKRELNEMRERYASLDEGQLKVALSEMYERLMFIGKSIKDQGEVIYDLSADAKDTYVIDNFEMKMNALLQALTHQDNPNMITPSMPKATYLDFKGANPKLPEMESKLLAWGKELKVPEMDKFEKWRDGQDYKNGPLVLTPFSQHSSRYNDSVATTKDLQDISSPEEIKRRVMSREEIEKAKAEMSKQEYIGGAFVNIQDTAEKITDRLPGITERPFELAEKNGLKREDVISCVAELARSKEFEEIDYNERCALFKSKNPKLAEALGNYDTSILVQVAEAMQENKKYIPAITEYLKKPENCGFDDKYNGKNAERLANYLRQQENGKLRDQEKTSLKQRLTTASKQGENSFQNETKKVSTPIKKSPNIVQMAKAKEKIGGM